MPSSDRRPPLATAPPAPGPLRVVDLTVRYRDRLALDQISLELPAHSFTCVLGPNGSGKSTLLSVLAGVLRPASGAVGFGEPPRRWSFADQGVVFQSPALDALRTVDENLRTAAILAGVRPRHVRQRIDLAAHDLAIQDRLRDRVGTLSGGLARRADLARALLHRPRVLLLDEPDAGLDLAAIDHLGLSLRTIAATRPACVIAATHRAELAETADHAVLMSAGRIAAHGSPAQLAARVGAAVLRIHPRDLERLPTTAIPGARSISQGTLAFADRLQAADACTMLFAHGLGVALAPPTLADAFRDLTGSTLEPPAAADTARPSGGHAR